MSDPAKQDHWRSLASLLGMAPSEPAPPAGVMEKADVTPVAPPAVSSPVSADVGSPINTAADSKAAEPKPAEPVASGIAPMKPRRGSHWNTLANMLGLGGLMASPEPEPSPPVEVRGSVPAAPDASSAAPSPVSPPATPNRPGFSAKSSVPVDPKSQVEQRVPSADRMGPPPQARTGERQEEPSARETRETRDRAGRDVRGSDDRDRGRRDRPGGGPSRDRTCASEPARSDVPREPAGDRSGEQPEEGEHVRRGRRRRRGSRGNYDRSDERLEADLREPTSRDEVLEPDEIENIPDGIGVEPDSSVPLDPNASSSETTERTGRRRRRRRGRRGRGDGPRSDRGADAGESHLPGAGLVRGEALGPVERPGDDLADELDDGLDEEFFEDPEGVESAEPRPTGTNRPANRQPSRHPNREQGRQPNREQGRTSNREQGRHPNREQSRQQDRPQERPANRPLNPPAERTPGATEDGPEGQSGRGRRRRRRGRRDGGAGVDPKRLPPRRGEAGMPLRDSSDRPKSRDDDDDDLLDNELVDDDRLEVGRFDRELVDDRAEDIVDDDLVDDDLIDDDLDDDLDDNLEGVIGDDGLEDAGSGNLQASHRGIPTWSETIGQIINTNMEARSKNPSQNYRGRGPRR